MMYNIHAISSQACMLYAALVDSGFLVVYRSPVVKTDSAMFAPVLALISGGAALSCPVQSSTRKFISSQALIDALTWGDTPKYVKSFEGSTSGGYGYRLEHEEVRQDDYMMFQKGIFSVYNKEVV